MNFFCLKILNSEKQIFSDLVKKIKLTGILGELGIYPGHAPLLTSIKPCNIYITDQHEFDRSIYVFGGVLVVQPKNVIVLANMMDHKKNF